MVYITHLSNFVLVHKGPVRSTRGPSVPSTDHILTASYTQVGVRGVELAARYKTVVIETANLVTCERKNFNVDE